ncbi:GlxA family transcriptional regulator [Pseudomonas sp. S75]|uniref:GlxA family transcriptional regulator n=1 Tax=unclassified Pseudomonas TaxID=196821 RepID=UPI001903E91F|nr:MULTISPECIES: GlxA family transcriptional regulator [unclassified Pseudomonas]MBJ9973886.1 GlxA family transcriptional regulator [Pseudomonas sp. S30]MBK0152184.1 GlxA family transcriptional regulator [Pseudomonas sp. S75]
MPTPRQFSKKTSTSNMLRLKSGNSDEQAPYRVGFVLLEHFSMASFTVAMDVLVTANLLRGDSFRFIPLSLDGDRILSDLGLELIASELEPQAVKALDLLVICGGLRTLLKYPELDRLIGECCAQGMALGGLWNGAWFLGRAGVLGDYGCSIHPEQRASLAERSPQTRITPASFTLDRDRLTAASPNGAMELMLGLVRRLYGDALAEGVEEILSFSGARYRQVGPGAKKSMSLQLRTIVELMENNLEETLSLDQLAVYSGRSRRQIDRLFQAQLGTSPRRYYMELRITKSRRLLQYSDLSVMDVAVACGFVSVSHFSKCYAAYFGYPPSREQRLGE